MADGANTLKYTSTTVTGLSAGAYTLRESDVAGYTEGRGSCTTGGTVTDNTISAGSVTLVNGADVTCTITNNDAPAQLTLVKRVVNDNGGAKVVGDFGLLTSAGTVTPFGAGVADGANTLKYTSTTVTGLSAGAYTLRESDVAGYTEGTWSCTTGGTVTDNTISAGSVTLVNGADVTCTITNNDIAPKIIIDKITKPTGSPTPFDFDGTGTGYVDFTLTDQQAPERADPQRRQLHRAGVGREWMGPDGHRWIDESQHAKRLHRNGRRRKHRNG